MSRYCPNCNSTLEDGTSFCTECGTKLSSAQTMILSDSPAEPRENPPLPQSSGDVGVGTFFALQFVFAIPLIGFIVCLVMCFAPKRKSLRSFARSTLIWTLIGILAVIGLFFAARLLSETIAERFDEIFASTESYGGLFESLSPMVFADGDLGSLLENADLSDLGGLLENIEPAEIAGILENVDPEALEGLLENVDPEAIEGFIENIDPAELGEILESIDPDTVDALLSDPELAALIDGISPEALESLS